MNTRTLLDTRPTLSLDRERALQVIEKIHIWVRNYQHEHPLQASTIEPLAHAIDDAQRRMLHPTRLLEAIERWTQQHLAALVSARRTATGSDVLVSSAASVVLDNLVHGPIAPPMFNNTLVDALVFWVMTSASGLPDTTKSPEWCSFWAWRMHYSHGDTV